MSTLSERAAEDCARLVNEAGDNGMWVVTHFTHNVVPIRLAFRTFREQAHTVAEQVEAWMTGTQPQVFSELRAIIAPLKLPEHADPFEKQAEELWHKIGGTTLGEGKTILATALRQVAQEARDA